MILQKELLELGKPKGELIIVLATHLGESQEMDIPRGKRYIDNRKQAGMSRAAF